MADHTLDIYKLSRRALLQAGGCAVAGATVAASAGSAFAKAKRSQADVAYVDHPKGGEKCSNCEPFIPPDACKTVSGTVSANGWCKIYVAK